MRLENVVPWGRSFHEYSFDAYIWKDITSIQALGRTRMASMEAFLADYEVGKKVGRYVKASLPTLSFEDNEFDLALCSHYLFLYSEHVDENSHVDAMLELCRVAQEVRVYPLIALDGSKSRHLDAVRASLKVKGIEVSLQPVEYLFQKGANEMLVAKRLEQ